MSKFVNHIPMELSSNILVNVYILKQFISLFGIKNDQQIIILKQLIAIKANIPISIVSWLSQMNDAMLQSLGILCTFQLILGAIAFQHFSLYKISSSIYEQIFSNFSKQKLLTRT
jgi:hypothetical protein